MNWDLMAVAMLAGAANWAFRVLPTLARTERLRMGGRFERFLGATGPAAIGTLFVASILPVLTADLQEMLPAAIGTGAVLLIYLKNRSVVGATLGGAVLYGLTFWWMT